MPRVFSCALIGVVAASLGCGGSGSLKSEPRFGCMNCAGNQRAVATHTVLDVATSWYGRCWSGDESGPLPTPGGDEGPNYKEWDCNAVDHAPKITCPGGRCTVRPVDPDAKLEMNERRFAVEVLTEGYYEVAVTFARDSGDQPRLAELVQVWRPNRFVAECDPWHAGMGEAGTRDLVVRLYHDDTELHDGPPQLELRRGDAACELRATAANGERSYRFRCAVPKPEATTPAQDVTVVGPDFRVTQSVACTE